MGVQCQAWRNGRLRGEGGTGILQEGLGVGREAGVPLGRPVAGKRGVVWGRRGWFPGRQAGAGAGVGVGAGQEERAVEGEGEGEVGRGGAGAQFGLGRGPGAGGVRAPASLLPGPQGSHSQVSALRGAKRASCSSERVGEWGEESH